MQSFYLFHVLLVEASETRVPKLEVRNLQEDNLDTLGNGAICNCLREIQGSS